MKRGKYPCTLQKSCYIKYLINLGLTQTEVALIVKVNVGSVCHVVHGRRHPNAYPVVPPGFEAAA